MTTTATSHAVPYESKEAIILLLAHMVCADEQIDYRELAVLRSFAGQFGDSEELQEEIEKIFRDQSDKPAVASLARSVSKSDRTEALRFLLMVAHADDHYCEDEQAFVESLRKTWHIPPGEVTRLRRDAVELLDRMSSEEANRRADDDDPSLASKAVGAMDSAMPTFLKFAMALAPESARHKVERLRQEFLLSGPEYDEAIERCREISEDDFVFAEKALDSAIELLADVEGKVSSHLKGVSRSKGKSAREAREQLEEIQKSVGEVLFQKIQRLKASLRRKRRTIGSFSIAFMGKTKVGKSTLYSVMTNEGWEGIGHGAQRTTRYNRIFEWKNIRMIDTPGIGAPGGKKDEEIAATVVDEADVICYLVTNDSQQESEFEVLQELKRRNKPLIILLNVKKNLEHPKRLQRFLKRPERLFKRRGKNSLEGHVDRIRRYASEYYDNDYFHIVPVQLLAAQISRQRRDEDYTDKLFEASRLPKFLDSIRVSLVEEGEVRRSQTFVGSASFDLEEAAQVLRNQAKSLTLLANTLEESQKKLLKVANRAARDTRKGGVALIEAELGKAKRAIPMFANNNWDVRSDKKLQKAWEQKMKRLGVRRGVEQGLKELTDDYEGRVKTAIEEVQQDIEFALECGSFVSDVTSVGSEKTVRRILKYGGGVASALGGLALVVGGAAAPFAWPLIIGGGFLAYIGKKLFNSKTKRQQKASKKIREKLLSEIDDVEIQTKREFRQKFNASHRELKQQLDSYFDNLIKELKALAEHLEQGYEDIEGIREKLNRRYAERILEWAAADKDKGIWEVISVSRHSGREMRIAVDQQPKLEVDTSKMGEVLQEDVELVVQSY